MGCLPSKGAWEGGRRDVRFFGVGNGRWWRKKGKRSQLLEWRRARRVLKRGRWEGWGWELFNGTDTDSTPILGSVCSFMYDTNKYYVIFVPLQDRKNVIGLNMQVRDRVTTTAQLGSVET